MYSAMQSKILVPLVIAMWVPQPPMQKNGSSTGSWSLVPGPRSPVPGPRSPVLGPRSSVPGPRSPVPGPRSLVPGPWSPVPGPRSSGPLFRPSRSQLLDQHMENLYTFVHLINSIITCQCTCVSALITFANLVLYYYVAGKFRIIKQALQSDIPGGIASAVYIPRREDSLAGFHSLFLFLLNDFFVTIETLYTDRCTIS